MRYRAEEPSAFGNTDSDAVDAYEPTEDWEILSRKLRLGEMRVPEYGSIRLDITHRTVFSPDTGAVESLSPTEFQILWVLVRAQGVPVKVSQIEEFLYRDRSEDEDRPMSNVVAVTIRKLRKKLANVNSSVFIPEQDVGGRQGKHQYWIEKREG